MAGQAIIMALAPRRGRGGNEEQEGHGEPTDTDYSHFDALRRVVCVRVEEAAVIWLRWYTLLVVLTTVDCVLIGLHQYLAAGAALFVTGYVLWKGRIG
jgi:hypothetical protein